MAGSPRGDGALLRGSLERYSYWRASASCSPPARCRASGGAQPLRAGRTAVADERGVCVPPAVAALHARLGPEPGVALPAFQGRGAPADQVDSLLRLGG